MSSRRLILYRTNPLKLHYRKRTTQASGATRVDSYEDVHTVIKNKEDIVEVKLQRGVKQGGPCLHYCLI